MPLQGIHREVHGGDAAGAYLTGTILASQSHCCRIDVGGTPSLLVEHLPGMDPPRKLSGG